MENGYMSDAPAFIQTLKDQRRSRTKGGIYHLTQIDMAFNTNRIEGSTLTREQTRFIFETQSVEGMASVRDIVETTNHFRMFDFMLDNLDSPLTAGKLKEYHRLLKSGTPDAELDYFAVGDWKRLANSVGGLDTVPPDGVEAAIDGLLATGRQEMEIEDIAGFHWRFESIHPFQDGNGRVGRIVMFEQCMVNGIMPFVVLDSHKAFYYRGLREYGNEPGFLIDTLKSFQDAYRLLYNGFVPPARAAGGKPPARCGVRGEATGKKGKRGGDSR